MNTSFAAAVLIWLVYLLMSCDAPALPRRASEDVKGIETVSQRERRAPATNTDEGVNVLPEISVEILGPITKLKGHEWSRGYHWVREEPNQPLSQILLEQPHDLVVQLPSGRTIRHVSKATFVKQERGTVVRASLMPCLSAPIRYQDAIALLESILERWDAEPNERTKESLAKWKAEGDLKPYALAERGGGAVLHGEDKVAISFQIRSTSSESGWYVALDVAATLEEARKLWGAPHAPASRPATEPSNGAD